MASSVLRTVRCDGFYVGIAHMFQRTERLEEYLEEIALLYHSDLPFYVFLRGHTLVYTTETDEMKAAGKFARTNLTGSSLTTYNQFSFVLDDEDDSLSMEATIDRQMDHRTREVVNETLKRYQIVQGLQPFDIKLIAVL